MENKERIQLINELQKLVNKVTEKFDSSNCELEDATDLELYEDLRFDGFDEWLQNTDTEQKLNPDFAVFGERGCGSKTAIWLLQNRDIKNAPVVLISSEGELGVIASDYLAFMAVSGLGYDMFQFLEGGDLASPWHSKNITFLDWLKSTYSVEPPKDLSKWLEETKNINPNLEQTVEEFKK